MRTAHSKPRNEWWIGVGAVLFAPGLLVVLLVEGVARLLFSACLHILIWMWWCRRGRDILFVTSDSPVWHDHIEQHVLAHLGERAVVLNWSHRRNWPFSLARSVFRHFDRQREYCPMAVVFRPFRRTHTFRFWRPFREFKNGRTASLQEMEREFFELIGVERLAPPADGPDSAGMA